MNVVSAACISAVILCVCTCLFLHTGPSVWFSPATLAAAFGEACVQCASLEDQLGFPRLDVRVHECMVMHSFVRRDGSKVAAVSCCSRAKRTVLTGLIN